MISFLRKVQGITMGFKINIRTNMTLPCYTTECTNNTSASKPPTSLSSGSRSASTTDSVTISQAATNAANTAQNTAASSSQQSQVNSDVDSATKARDEASKKRLNDNIDYFNKSIAAIRPSGSSINDVDLAGESAQSTRLQTLTQAGASTLAQSNSSPQTVLRLIG